MKAFPHLVEMHKENSNKGLVILTVSLDEPDNQKQIDDANKFLRRTKAPFPAFHLNEPSELWNKKLDFNLPPCYFIFDRHGKWVRYRGADYDDPEKMYKEMDAAILRMLAEK